MVFSVRAEFRQIKGHSRITSRKGGGVFDFCDKVRQRMDGFQCGPFSEQIWFHIKKIWHSYFDVILAIFTF